MLRIGQGVDVHPFAEERPLILGGVKISERNGLLGHSDADVLLHAIMDALLGAVGEGDIGELFPDTDPQYLNADSKKLLSKVWGKISAEGWYLVNLDCTVLAEQPRLSPFKSRIQESIAEVFGVESAACGLKATTTEKLGFVGRREGIMVLAVVLLEK